MSRTHKDRLKVGPFNAPRWRNPQTGRWFKRRYHKAVRQWQKGHGGRERAVRHWASECNWKGE